MSGGRCSGIRGGGDGRSGGFGCQVCACVFVYVVRDIVLWVVGLCVA